MRVAAALLCGLAVASAAVARGPRDKYVEVSKATVSKSKSANAGFGSTIASTCTTEIEQIKTTIAEAEKLGGQDLVQQKAQLGDALQKRILGIEAIIAALKKYELQLNDHVKRTNTVFELRYKQYMEDMTTSATLLKELGLLVAEPSSPGVKKIVLSGNIKINATEIHTPDAPGAEAETGEKATGASVSASAQRFRGKAVKAAKAARVALIELSKVRSFQELMESASQSQTPAQCTTAWDNAFKLYKSGHDAHFVNDGFFEKERVALNKHLKLIRELTEKKKAKLAKLKDQLAAVKKTTAIPEENIGLRIVESLKIHKNLIETACPQIKQLNEKAAQQKDEVIASMTACSKSDFGKIASVEGAAVHPEEKAATQPSASSGTLVSGTVTHVPDAPPTGEMQPMDVVTTDQGGKSSGQPSGQPVTVAIPPATVVGSAQAGVQAGGQGSAQL